MAEGRLHAPAALGTLLTLREQAREAIPVVDALEDQDLVMPAGPRRHHEAAGDRDHAGARFLGTENPAERIDVGFELAREGPSRVVEVETRLGDLRRRRRGQVDLVARGPGYGQKDLGGDVLTEVPRLLVPVAEARVSATACHQIAPRCPVADGGQGDGLIARAGAVR